MPDKSRRIPRTIWLAEGKAIKVVFEPPAVITAGYGEPGKAGFYDPKTFTIHIDKTVNKNRKWAIFRHELIHAVIDTEVEVNGGI
jgi:hypothetical protein